MSDKTPQQTEAKKKILSVDPGINFCGICVVDTNEGFVVVDTILVKNARSFTAEEKIVEAAFGPRAVKVAAIITKLETLIKEHDIDTIVVEAPFYNALTPMAYGSLLEVIFAIKYCVVIKQNLKFSLIEPTLVKKLFANKGTAAKEAMRQFLTAKKASGEIVLPFEIDNMSEHEVDAVAIGFVFNLSTQVEKT